MITYSREGGFVIHKGDGTIQRFVKSDIGLFYLYVAKNKKRKAGQRILPYLTQ